jgi:hypothetical protein
MSPVMTRERGADMRNDVLKRRPEILTPLSPNCQTWRTTFSSLLRA